MSTVIESVIKTNPLGRWYIELSDTMKDDSMEICLDINEYAKKVDMMGVEYGGEVEILWSSEDDVTPIQINEVRQQIVTYEAELEANKENGLSQNQDTHQADGTPNFSA